MGSYYIFTMEEKKLESILRPIRAFLNIFGVDFGANKKHPLYQFSKQIKSLWTLLWLVISLQYAIYTLTQLAFPNLIYSLLTKGVLSQMNSFNAFLSHVNLASTVVICHWVLLFNLRKVSNIFITTSTFRNDKINWRRFSILGIIGICLSVYI